MCANTPLVTTLTPMTDFRESDTMSLF
ncbi:peptide-methionine (S)-S-oxide reductase, partial [Shigella flexneri]